mgnify:CR=1 FL=1
MNNVKKHHENIKFIVNPGKKLMNQQTSTDSCDIFQQSGSNDSLQMNSHLFRKRNQKKYNNWTSSEDLLLLELCLSKFPQKWKKIASILKNKTPRMCEYRVRKLKKYVKYNN